MSDPHPTGPSAAGDRTDPGAPREAWPRTRYADPGDTSPPPPPRESHPERRPDGDTHAGPAGRTDGRNDTRDDVRPDPTPERPTAGLLAQEREAFGGVKVGAAFFGLLAALGTIAILTALVAAVAGGLDLDVTTSSSDLSGVGLAAAIVLAAVLFVGYLAGGYVAGRMSRFQGARQGVAVWLWAVVLAVVLGVLAAIVGDDSLAVRSNLPSVPFTDGGFTWQAVLALVAVLVVTLVGAVLGGLLGMRFHRRVDRFADRVSG